MSEEDTQKIAQFESVLAWLVKKVKEQDSRINELENCCMHESTRTAIPQ